MSHQYEFEKWLAGALSESEANALYKKLQKQAPELAERMRFAETINNLALSYKESEVPLWDREKTMPFEKAQLRFWQRPMGLASLAFSFFAVMVVTLQIYKTEFEESVDERVEMLVAKEISTLREEQKTALAMYGKDLREDFRKQLSTSTTQLATYILTTNRKESRENLLELVEYVNETREEDYNFYLAQLRRIESPVWPKMTETEQ